jgi:hypothetical protein
MRGVRRAATRAPRRRPGAAPRRPAPGRAPQLFGESTVWTCTAHGGEKDVHRAYGPMTTCPWCGEAGGALARRALRVVAARGPAAGGRLWWPARPAARPRPPAPRPPGQARSTLPARPRRTLLCPYPELLAVPDITQDARFKDTVGFRGCVGV